MNFINIKVLCYLKEIETIKKMKRQGIYWEKIFASYMPQKESSRMYKGTLKLNNKKQTNQLNGKTLKQIFY